MAATGAGGWFLTRPAAASSASIAVLPFANLSGDPAQAYFSDGIAEELRNEDDKIDELHVSVFEKVLSDSWQGEAAATIDATLASRYHERFADHAVSISKKVTYLATGDWTVDSDDSFVLPTSPA